MRLNAFVRPLLPLALGPALLLAQAPPAVPAAAPRPVTLELVYTGDVIGVARGGLERDATYLDNLDLKMHLDVARVVRWPGALLFAYVLSNRGGLPSDFVGDAQGVSNIAAPVAWRLYELWLQQNLYAGRLSVLAGLYDINSEFDAIQSAGLFINSSFGIGAELGTSGRNGPSIFPTTSLGVRVKYKPRPGLYAEFGLFDGVPGDPRDPQSNRITLSRDEGALLLAEVALLPGAAERPEPIASRVAGRNRGRRIGRGQNAVRYDGKYALGVWRYTGRYEDLAARDAFGAPVLREGSYGIYALGEHKLFRSDDSERGLSAFARVGVSNEAVNRFGSYAGAGLTYAGPFAGRPDDEAGIAIAVANNGSSYRRAVAAAGGQTLTREASVEVSYRFQILPAFALQPDLQWVIHPGTDPNIRNALVLGLRAEGAIKW